MTGKFTPYNVVKASLSSVPIKEGQLIFATDTRELFFDITSSQRVQCVMPIPSPLPVSQGGTGGTTAAAARLALGVPAPTFTYVVDTSAKLQNWGLNDPTDGNDYSHVLIKKGTWTSGVEVNLTNTGTKVVVGEAGSLLSFTSQRGLHYTTMPTGGDCWMQGVNVEMSYTAGSMCYGIIRGINLSACTVKTTVSTGSYGFYYCQNLTSCKGIGIADSVSGVGVGFYFCKGLVLCMGTGKAGAGGAGGHGFQSCRRMLLCKQDDSIQSTGTTFDSCYMHDSGTTDPVADTAAGGWNYAQAIIV